MATPIVITVKMYHNAKQKGMFCFHPLHGHKGLNYAAKDTPKNRAEAERLVKMRSGSGNVHEFLWA